jgi:hypothetical protein
MRLHEINWSPEVRHLRQFGLIALPVLPLAGCIFSAPANVTAGLAVLGAVAAALAILRPSALRWPFVALSILTWPIGLVVSEIVLLLVYFGVFTPLALAMRLVGRDPLERRWLPNARSYWSPHAAPNDPARYFHQY